MSADGSHYGRVVAGLAGLAAVIAVGTLGYIVIDGWSFLDAIYMTVTVVTTVGFREVRPLDTEGRVFTIGLVLVGVGFAFYILTAMVAAIIEGDLGQEFGARRMRRSIGRLKGHYIVCGYGRVGAEIARELRDRDAPILVVDFAGTALERAEADGMLVHAGDATNEAILINAGIERCRALVAASDSDAANTYITLTAKGLNPDVFVVARVTTLAVESKLRQAGADRVVSPYTIGGRRMALAALQPLIADFIDLLPGGPAGERLLAELTVDEDSGLADREISEALASCQDVVVLALRDSQGRLNVGPGRSTRLTTGDTLLIIGGEDELRLIGAVARRESRR